MNQIYTAKGDFIIIERCIYDNFYIFEQAFYKNGLLDEINYYANKELLNVLHQMVALNY